MISKQQLIDSMLSEIRIIKHLATKIPPGGMHYRPSDHQRNMVELMQYLTICAIVPAYAAVRGNWDDAEELEKDVENVNELNFARAMNEQARKLKHLINNVSSHDLAHKDTLTPWGSPVKVGQGLMDMALKPLVAYRMQFFLYVKAAGRKDIGPAQCWVGVDPRPQPAKA